MAADRVQLFGKYSFRPMPREEFFPLFKQHWKAVFGDEFLFHVHEVLSEEEKQGIKALRRRLEGRFELCVFIYHEDSVVGWSYGQQTTDEEFYMVNTGLFPEHQNQGVYTSLLPAILKELREEGFQIVTSQHRLSNSQVLVPKLKAGFCITGFRITDRFGPLLELSYYFNETRRKAIEFRFGSIGLDEKLSSLFGR